jgi:hypothetical protein
MESPSQPIQSSTTQFLNNLTASNPDYFEVTQDGIGRLFFNSEEKVQGLFTEKLETCIAIIIIGSKGISLIHNTGRISSDSIKNEVELLGELNCFLVAYNPQEYPNGIDDNEYKDMRYFEDKVCSKLKATEPVEFNELNLKNSEIIQVFKAEQALISINHEVKINITEKPANIKLLPNKDKRHRINILNNYFSEYENYLPGDVQYNGAAYSRCSNLLI